MHMDKNLGLNQIAQDNYRSLSYFCSLLDVDGYWDKPASVLCKSSEEILNIYVQTVLVSMGAYLNRLGQDELDFIANVGTNDPLGVRDNDDIEAIKTESERFLRTPPILYQLFSLRDMEKEKAVAGLFFDGILNIMLCMSYLNGRRDPAIAKYLGMYYDRVSTYLKDSRRHVAGVDQKYIFKKLCLDNISNSAEWLLRANEDFAVYKREHLYYRQEMMTDVYTVFTNSAAEMKQDDPRNNKIMPEISSELTEHEPDIQEQTNNSITNDQEGIVQNPVQSDDEDKDVFINRTIRNSELDRLLKELDDLIGLDDVKKEIHSLINLIKVRRLRSKYGLPEMEMSYHMVFTGNPGTGKTTVARIVGKIYKELEIVSGGEMIETDRSGLVAGYVGQTAIKVKETVDKALGGVLFIDEAYSLAPASQGNDFGSEAIDTLVKLMEDHREDLVVIAAGYTDEMKNFLKSNTGLQSRFNKFIEFPDYSVDELLLILGNMARKAGFCLTDELMDKVRKDLEARTPEQIKNFGNARGIRNMFESMVVAQANRVVTIDDPSVDDLSKITQEDHSFKFYS